MESLTVEIPQGETVYGAAKQAGIVLQRGVRGRSSMRRKRAVLGNRVRHLPAHARSLRSQRSELEERILNRRLPKGGKRLGCQCVPQRDLTVVTMP